LRQFILIDSSFDFSAPRLFFSCAGSALWPILSFDFQVLHRRPWPERKHTQRSRQISDPDFIFSAAVVVCTAGFLIRSWFPSPGLGAQFSASLRRFLVRSSLIVVAARERMSSISFGLVDQSASVLFLSYRIKKFELY
jgi:hypothetical protein